jgi:predicted metal-dependent peptidase
VAKKKKVEEQDIKQDPQDVLEETMMELVFSEPFYANLMLNMKRMFTTDIPTLGVMPPGTEMSGDQIALIVNPYFFCSLTLKERVEVLKHECHHVIMNHFVRFRDLEPQIYDEKNPKSISSKIEDAMNASTLNKAADYAINEYLPNLPKNFKIFDKEGNPIVHDKEMQDPKDPTKKIANPNAGKAIQTGCLLVDELKKQIKGVKNRQNTEYYYEILCQENEKNPQSGQGQGMLLDDHSMWHQGNASEEEITAKVKEVVNKAVEQTDQRAIGNLPADVQAAIEALNHVPKDWRQDLQRFVARQIEILVESTRKRRNRRYGILYPGLQKLPVMHLAVAIDTSGSVNDEELAQFIAEIDRIHKLNVKVTVIECDAEVQAVYDFDPRKKIQVKGRGGTRFAPVFEHIKNNKMDVDGLIYLTDGGCWESSSDIEKPRYPVMWAVLKSYAKNFNWSWGSKTEIEVTKKVRR